jgi:tRNA 5-methylaminomethyl-2-thiouridine biosynthesis bifunctional protein
MGADGRHALVLGAGLAGAAVCSALSARGWRLTVLDAADGPAAGASALPVGMLSPHVTRNPTALSRLSAVGVAAMRAELQRLVPPGAGWLDGEVDNRGHDAGRWPAARVRPAALVQAWLHQALSTGLLTCQWGARVAALHQADGQWQALDADRRRLAEARAVVLCGAWGSHALLHASGLASDTALPLRPVQGQLSLGPLDDAPDAARPQRDSGVFVPEYTDSGLAPAWPTRVWAMGSTYDRGLADTEVTPERHQRNADSLQALCARAAERMERQRQAGHLLGWAGVRCASLDRLPLAGAWVDEAALAHTLQRPRRGKLPLAEVPRHHGLYMLTALGSRGLTLSSLCAERVADAMDGTPSPLPADLQATLDPARFAWRAAYKA